MNAARASWLLCATHVALPLFLVSRFVPASHGERAARPTAWAAVFETRPPRASAELAEDLLSSLVDATSFEIAAGGQAWIFEPVHPIDAGELAAALSTVLGAVLEPEPDVAPDVRVGRVVERTGDHLAVLDGRLAVAFPETAAAADVERLLAESGARLRRRLPQLGTGWIVEVPGLDPLDVVALARSWEERGDVLWAEPDLVRATSADGFPADAPPVEWRSPGHGNLARQGVLDAWRLLRRELGEAAALGAASVRVATLDKGVDPSHEDVNAERLVLCHSLVSGEPCASKRFVHDRDGHGMAVYGIVGARANNAPGGVTGIAPGTSHVALQVSELASGESHGPALLWVAGLAPGKELPGLPPTSPFPADVVSVSQGVDCRDGWMRRNLCTGAPARELSAALEHATTYGRGGRGTVLVFSTGNSRHDLADYRPWAAHERTLAVGRTAWELVDGAWHETWRGCGVGAIDLVAASATTRVLGWKPDLYATFAGTSAAAPMVAGAAALVLTANPDLTWIEVRDVLRASAVRVEPSEPWQDYVDGRSPAFGYGRLDVAAAVRAALDLRGEDAVRLVIRDTLDDDGAAPVRERDARASPDVWLRAAGAPKELPDYDADPESDVPRAGVDATVFVRVRNAGERPASTYWVRAYLGHASSTRLAYPDDWIPRPDSSGDARVLLLGSERREGLAPGAVDVVRFDLPGAWLAPGGPERGVLALMAEVSPHAGLAGDARTIAGNRNLAARHVSVADGGHAAPDAPLLRTWRVALGSAPVSETATWRVRVEVEGLAPDVELHVVPPHDAESRSAERLRVPPEGLELLVAPAAVSPALALELRVHAGTPRGAAVVRIAELVGDAEVGGANVPLSW